MVEEETSVVKMALVAAVVEDTEAVETAVMDLCYA